MLKKVLSIGGGLLLRRCASAATVCIILLFSVVPASHADDFPVVGSPFFVDRLYEKSEHMIPMRDGVRLYTVVYAPRDRSHTYPIMIRRTPYSVAPYGRDEYMSPMGPSEYFDREGFIFVHQDIRGKFRSEGEFEVIRPYVPDKPENDRRARRSHTDDSANGIVVDESTDLYDTVEWLLENVPNHNGRVGQWGISYGGYEVVMGMIDPHPAIVASSPQASPADMFIGDDWHHNGAFRYMYAFHWLWHNAQPRAGITERPVPPFDYGTPWSYKFFLDAGPVKRINELYFENEIAPWNEYMEHGTYDEYWQRRNVLRHLDDVEHPVLNVAGWFDAEDFYGPMSIYKTIEENVDDNRSTLVVGPWMHGGWSRTQGLRLGPIEFGSKTSLFFQRDVELPFFNNHLKGQGNWAGPEAIVFETGRNEWRMHESWPPAGVVGRVLYLQPDGGLGFDRHQGDDAYDEYVSDPDNPIPYTSEISNIQGHLWMVEDQRFASTRPDVLVYQSEPLKQDITVAGPITARLYVSTTGTDADYAVKLIDVYPSDAPNAAPPYSSVAMGDYQMLLSAEIMRAKFRDSYVKPEPLDPGKVTEIEITLPERYHTFLKGHRIMVQVQSTWFPLYDRNPHKFMDIYEADVADFESARHRIYRTEEYPSGLDLTVLRAPKDESE